MGQVKNIFNACFIFRTAKIWSVKNNEFIQIECLSGHAQAVWSVLAMNTEIILTGLFKCMHL